MSAVKSAKAVVLGHMALDSLEKITTSTISTVASRQEPIANDTTSSLAVVSESSQTAVSDESMTTPVAVPATRRRTAVNKSLTSPENLAVVSCAQGTVAVATKKQKLVLTKAADRSSTSAIATALPDGSTGSETAIALKSDSYDIIRHENSDPPESKKLVSSPRKRQLKTSNSLEPKPEKRTRTSKSKTRDCSDSIASGADMVQNSFLKQRKNKPKAVSESPATALRPELMGKPEISISEASNSDLTLTENSFISESKGSAGSETLESPKKNESHSVKAKQVRNPYGRRGKPGKCSTTGIYPSVKPKKPKASAVLHCGAKVEPSELDTVKPEWLKPFEEGWRREIVYRNTTTDTAGGRKCDIYYFTPDSCKLRSTPQIISYLSKHNTSLTGSCFTFVKRLIYSEPAEFVRNAGLSGRRSEIATSAKRKKSHKKHKSLPGKSEIVLQKPALKLKLKRQKFKKSSKKVTVSAMSEVSMVASDADVSHEEPQCHSTPLASETKPSVESSSLPSASSSKWKLVKPKKASGKQSSALVESVQNEGKQVTETDGISLPPEVPDKPAEALVPSSETQMPVAEVSQPQTLAPVPQKSENKDSKSDLKLSPTVTSVVELNFADENRAKKLLSEKKSSGKSVAKKSTAKKAKLVQKVDSVKVKMLYREGLPDRAVLQTNTPVGQESNHVSTTRSSNVQAKPSFDDNSSSGAVAKQTKQPPSRKQNDPFFNPVSDIRRCGLHCAGRYGMSPSLHCDICMCMFHPECVGMMHAPHRTSFTCKACYGLNADFSGSNSFDDNMVPNSRLAPPQPRRTDIHVRTSDTGTSSAVPLPSSINHSTFSSLAVPQVTTASGPSSSADVSENVTLTGTDPAKPSCRVLSLPRSLASLLDLSRPVTLSLDGRKFSVPGSCFAVTADGVKVVLPNNIFPDTAVPNTNVPPNIPPSTSQPFGTDQSSSHATSVVQSRILDVSPVQSEICPKMITSERNCETYTQDEFNSSGEPVRVNNSVEYFRGDGQHESDPRLSNGSVSELTTTDSNGRNVIMDSSVVNAFCKGEGEIEGGCLLQIIFNADLMLRIFKFLNIADLLKASQVCTAWLKVSKHSSLWKSVDLSGVKVFDWDLAAQHLTKCCTKCLNLSRLVHSGGENQTWHQLTAAFSSLTTVRHLLLGPCPANLVYFAASKMVELESLKAVQIMDVGSENSTNSPSSRSRNTKLDIGKMAVLRNLVRLELRGLNGLVLPSFSFTGGLAELAQLTELKHLSITSLRDVPGREFHFLSHLEKLEVFEVGDCTLWTKENYEHLGQLTRLKRLKLECGIDSTETGLDATLRSLPCLEHLELSSFRVSKSSADFLSKMRQLKVLRLYSDTHLEASSSNSYMLSAVKKMTFLAEMTWSILALDVQIGSADASSKDSHPHLDKLLPFTLETRPDEDTAVLEGKSSSVEWKSVENLESVLKEDLPSTVVHVLAAQNDESC